MEICKDCKDPFFCNTLICECEIIHDLNKRLENNKENITLIIEHKISFEYEKSSKPNAN